MKRTICMSGKWGQRLGGGPGAREARSLPPCPVAIKFCSFFLVSFCKGKKSEQKKHTFKNYSSTRSKHTCPLQGTCSLDYIYIQRSCICIGTSVIHSPSQSRIHMQHVGSYGPLAGVHYSEVVNCDIRDPFIHKDAQIGSTHESSNTDHWVQRRVEAGRCSVLVLWFLHNHHSAVRVVGAVIAHTSKNSPAAKFRKVDNTGEQ